MIVLVGGVFTPDGGGRIDSRQRIEGDDGSEVMRRSLRASWFWWSIVSSLVLPILESAGPRAYALVIGERSLQELKSDGSTERTSLLKLLPGVAGEVSFVRPAEGEPKPLGGHTYAFPPGGDVRWLFVEGDDPDLERFPESARPTVIVDTTSAVYSDTPHTRLDSYQLMQRRFVGPTPAILVLPHTTAAETSAKAYIESDTAERPRVMPRHRPGSDGTWLDTPPDPIQFTTMVPVQADFRVSGLVKNRTWAPPDDLEAARQLLQARFDLRIGIWDLVDNPVLRESLLVGSPVEPAPTTPSKVPSGAAARAATAVEKKLAQQERHREIYAVSWPLEALGWVRTQLEPYSLLCLPLSEPVPFGPNPRPVAWLAVSLTRHQAQVIARGLMAVPGLSLGGHIEQRRAAFEAISGMEVAVNGGLSTLWKEPGGWADDLDWETRFRALAQKSTGWSAELAPAAASLFATLSKMRWGTSVVGVS